MTFQFFSSEALANSNIISHKASLSDGVQVGPWFSQRVHRKNKAPNFKSSFL